MDGMTTRLATVALLLAVGACAAPKPSRPPVVRPVVVPSVKATEPPEVWTPVPGLDGAYEVSNLHHLRIGRPTP